MRRRRGTQWSEVSTPEGLEQINQENRMAIRLLAAFGIPLSVANYFAQTIFSNGFALSLKSIWLLLYFLCLFLLDRFVIPPKCRNTTLVLYLLEAPVMIFSILLGTAWDPTHQALTFLMFLMAMPVFVLDRPVRLLSIETGWVVIFLAACRLCKDPSTFRGDFFHALEFYLATSAVTSVVLRVRIESLRNLERTRYHLEHDELTGMKNRSALVRHPEPYLRRPLLVLTGDLDQLNLYNDFFGRGVGDEMLTSFTQAFCSQFGSEDSYRMGGDEVVCLIPEMEPEQLSALAEKCRSRLRRLEFNGRIITLNCSFGYVTGTAEDLTALTGMVQLSNIYAHKAVQVGRDQTIGGPYSPESLQDAIRESNIATNARVYETNQLTGLPSMSYFITHSDEMLNHLVYRDRHPVIGFFNVIRFRDFNEAFGYAQGDILIRDTARLLQQAFPDRKLCSISGSQFGILCYLDEAAPGLEQMEAALDSYRPGFHLGCKAGFAAFTGTESALSLLDQAKTAHDSIRNAPNQTCRFYDAELDEELHFRQYLTSHLEKAMREGWLKVYYQPIIRSVSRKVCNEEALSRWDDPRYGFLTPDRFIPVLEEQRLIYKLSLHVVRTVLADFKRRESEGFPVVPVSVNLSRHDFEQCDMVESISALVDESGYGRDMISIEITESAFTENPQELKRQVDRFRQAGFQVWLDDFGSEYSTLNLLQEMHFDLIKLDMQFMRNYNEERSSVIISDMIDMCKRLGTTTLIEGVETREHYMLLRAMGCEKLQGFYFDRPNALDQIISRVLEQDEKSMIEPTAEAAYYAEVGRLNLLSPLSAASKSFDPHFSAELPAGVLEYRQDRLYCLRATKGMLTKLQHLGLLEQDSSLEHSALPMKDHLPAPLLEAARRCSTRKEWVGFTLEQPGDRPLTCYAIQVAENPVSGSFAILVVLLPGYLKEQETS